MFNLQFYNTCTSSQKSTGLRTQRISTAQHTVFLRLYMIGGGQAIMQFTSAL